MNNYLKNIINYKGNYCIDCDKEICKISIRCNPCAGKSRRGENSPCWKGGAKNSSYWEGNGQINYCLDCKKIISIRAKRCRSCRNKGKNNPMYGKYGGNNGMYGKKHTEETKQKMRIISRPSGENHYNYIDGQSCKPYPIEFNNQLKQKIKKRDDYTCQNCGIIEEEHIIVFGRVLSVHHIDYNKKNNQENNHITLCTNCNIRANFNREYWERFYQEKIKQIYLSEIF